MKERPILFSGPMVRALLAGMKTQTRRTIKPVGKDQGFVILEGADGTFASRDVNWPYRSDDGDVAYHTVTRSGEEFQDQTPHTCPYGQPGDRLWVRESFLVMDRDHWEDSTKPKDFLSTRYGQPRRNACAYRATSDVDADAIRCRFELGYKRWTPSIHMPRWASRITLEITSVRVERLWDISEADARAEGCTIRTYRDGRGEEPATVAYRALWQDINGSDSWDANPWVWVVEFKRVEP